jgi:hypothetical protein
MGNPPYNVGSTQFLSTLSAVAAKNYEFERKKTAYFARRTSAMKFATGSAALRLFANRGRPEVIGAQSE